MSLYLIWPKLMNNFDRSCFELDGTNLSHWSSETFWNYIVTSLVCSCLVSLQAGQFWLEKSDQHEVSANINSHKNEANDSRASHVPCKRVQRVFIGAFSSSTVRWLFPRQHTKLVHAELLGWKYDVADITWILCWADIFRSMLKKEWISKHNFFGLSSVARIKGIVWNIWSLMAGR